MINADFQNTRLQVLSNIYSLAEVHNAYNLAVDYPDFECPKDLIALVNSYMKKGYNHYSPSEGIMPLREKIAELTRDNYSCDYDPQSQVTITAGAAQALFTSISCLIEDGDEVVIVEPVNRNYIPAIERNGGKAVFVQMKHPGFYIDWDEVQKLITGKTRVIIISTPHDPTGMIFSAQDMEKLLKIINGTKITVLSDEVFESIVFENYEHQSIARFPKLAERSIIVSSFGKVLNNTGWKIGHCLASAKLTRRFRQVQQFQISSVNTPIQYALAEFIGNNKDIMLAGNYYQQKRDAFNNKIKKSGFKILPAKGTYFEVLNFKDIEPGTKDIEFAEKLVKEHGIATAPLSVFYHDKVDNKNLRINFAKSEEVLEKAAGQLLKVG
jgi:methionine transaminase